MPPDLAHRLPGGIIIFIMSTIGTHLVLVLVQVRAWVWVQGGGRGRLLIGIILRGLRQGRKDVTRWEGVQDPTLFLLGSAPPEVGQEQGGVQMGEVVVAVAAAMVEVAPTRMSRAALAIMIIPRLVLDGGRLGGRMRPGGDCIASWALEEISDYVLVCSFHFCSFAFFFSLILHCLSLISFCSLYFCI
jgi:hypothetical protein